MGLLSKSKSREADNAPSNDSDEDEGAAPPPYQFYYTHVPQEYDVKDEKASLASLDDDEKTEQTDDDDPEDESDPQSVWLDVRKADKGGASIVERATGRVLYTRCKDKRFTAGNVLIFKGDVSQEPEIRNTSGSGSTSASTSTSTSGPASPAVPYVTIKLYSVYVGDPSNPQAAPTKYKNNEFLRPQKWYAAPTTFSHQGTDYCMKAIKGGWTGKLALSLADDYEKKPLCIFRAKLFGKLRGTIEILPTALSFSKEAPNQHALLHDGQPTQLLDLTLVAERMRRRYDEQAAVVANA